MRVAAALETFGVTARDSAARLESRSGAGVHAVRTAAGVPAYLKVVPATSGPDALASARRELAFYLRVAPAAPVGTPALIDWADTGEGVALLLAAAGDPVPVAAWTPDMWAALGRDLAALHAMPPPAGDWRRADGLRQAVDAPGLPMIERFWGPVLPRLTDLLDRRDALLRDMEAAPAVFVHGDCHTDNVLRDGEALVLADWQVCGTGRPGTDLAFLQVRAAPAGVTVPAELLGAYLAGRPGERGTLERAILAEELGTFVFQWPAFAAYNTPAGVDRVRRRTAALADRWLTRNGG